MPEDGKDKTGGSTAGSAAMPGSSVGAGGPGDKSIIVRQSATMAAVQQLFTRIIRDMETKKPANCIHFIVDFLCKHYPEHLHGFASIWNSDPDLEQERQEVCQFFKKHKISTQIAAHFTNAGYDTLETLVTLSIDTLADIEAFNNVRWLPGHKVRLQQVFAEIDELVLDFKNEKDAEEQKKRDAESQRELAAQNAAFLQQQQVQEVQRAQQASLMGGMNPMIMPPGSAMTPQAMTSMTASMASIISTGGNNGVAMTPMSATQLASMQGRVGGSVGGNTSNSGAVTDNSGLGASNTGSSQKKKDESKKSASQSINADPSPTTTDPGASGVVTQALNTSQNHGTVIPGTASGSFTLPATYSTAPGTSGGSFISGSGAQPQFNFGLGQGLQLGGGLTQPSLLGQGGGMQRSG